MADTLTKLANSPLTGGLVRALGLPTPPALARAKEGWVAQPFVDRGVVLGAAPGGFATEAARSALSGAGARVLDAPPAQEGRGVDVVVFDATGLATPTDARALYDFFHPVVPRLARNARVLVLASLPEEAAGPAAAAVARGVEGFVRSLGKEVGRRGATANLAYVARGAEDRLAGPVRYFCGVQTTYVSGQAVRVTSTARAPASVPRVSALRGRVALVTGAARGIGAATAERLAQEGARVVLLDVPALQEALGATAARVGGEALALDVTAPDAPARLVEELKGRHGGVDVVVHNAGITRDRTLAKMTPEAWDQVLAVNLAAIVAADDALLASGALRDEGRLVYLSSISGVAGNFGQTNYAATKAALIGYVAALAPRLAPRGICANAVAPGFIETAMVAKMPLMTREVGRRLNSLSQGGLPRDVAELITFLGSPGAYGLTGNTVRACGQGLIGA
ncbi:3-oxoacyl-ACP reductase [Pyxidicoccus fallax]|uniref:3-oxoacyl-ACP reductase n=1 Tax=Pyxidicoccus fallax TaxID=394095 RepID=A0A848L776_9BACT|nr:3-oxoacyl-ACP reductase [Pyxidicoccus fallax]NMO14609.1 3-oxoacyl-ACP reductase [Pyxidicoccus fallax]NPC77373.1 3-oxoacyl-ACP reductase [Pyxidicoccus fallax]